MNLDPHSERISWNPTPDLALQVSHGYLKSPEGNASPARTEPDAKRHRTTASLIYNKSLGPDSLNAISIGYVRDLSHGTTSTSAWAARSPSISGRASWIAITAADRAMDFRFFCEFGRHYIRTQDCRPSLLAAP